MMDTIMPDIPRFYTALAEWLACMIFILPLKKKMAKKTIPLMAGALVVQSVFLCCDRESDDLFLDSVYGHCGNFDDRIYLWML